MNRIVKIPYKRLRQINQALHLFKEEVANTDAYFAKNPLIIAVEDEDWRSDYIVIDTIKSIKFYSVGNWKKDLKILNS